MLQKNRQLPVAPHYDESGDLVVHSIFPTIQGEGPFAGQRAVFIRLAHCNLQCPGCDTEYTEGAATMTVTQVIGEVLKVGINYDLVVITGGEPFRQYLRVLIRDLHNYQYKVQIETNGVLYPYDVDPDVTVVVSPKTNKIDERWYKRANAFKYVLKDGEVASDGLPTRALMHKANGGVARPPVDYPHDRIYVQPMDEKDTECNAANIAACVESVQSYGYILCLQMHKYIGVE